MSTRCYKGPYYCGLFFARFSKQRIVGAQTDILQCVVGGLSMADNEYFHKIYLLDSEIDLVYNFRVSAFAENLLKGRI